MAPDNRGKLKKSFPSAPSQSVINAFVRATAEGDNDSVIEFLDKYGSCINARDSHGDTALTRATRYGNTNTVELLIERGADIDKTNSINWTALMLAAMYGHKDIAELLVDSGANVKLKNDSGSTAERLAKINNEKEIVTLIKGAKKTKKNQVIKPVPAPA